MKVTNAKEVDALRKLYKKIAASLDQNHLRSVRLAFDQSSSQFREDWLRLYAENKDNPEAAVETAKKLIEASQQPLAIALAMSRFNEAELFSDFARFFESVLRAGDTQEGDLRILAIPHLVAGYFYMMSGSVSVAFQGWRVVRELLSRALKYYEHSLRASSSYGFDLGCLFHLDCMDRQASRAHDFYRELLLNGPLPSAIGMEKHELLDTYIQFQMLLCLRAAQERERGNWANIWPDFGRFRDHRVVGLLDTLQRGEEPAHPLFEAFGEKRDEWFARLNPRLSLIRQEFWGKSGPFLWQSIETYEPPHREA